MQETLNRPARNWCEVDIKNTWASHRKHVAYRVLRRVCSNAPRTGSFRTGLWLPQTTFQHFEQEGQHERHQQTDQDTDNQQLHCAFRGFGIG